MNPNEPEQNLGPVCETTGAYKSRCEHCGAEPLNAAASEPAAPTLAGVCNDMRAQLLVLENETRLWVKNKWVSGEAAAQAMLAVRHLEDARMRLGKVIQHTDGGGVSCWDSGRKPGDDGR